MILFTWLSFPSILTVFRFCFRDEKVDLGFLFELRMNCLLLANTLGSLAVVSNELIDIHVIYIHSATGKQSADASSRGRV